MEGLPKRKKRPERLNALLQCSALRKTRESDVAGTGLNAAVPVKPRAMATPHLERRTTANQYPLSIIHAATVADGKPGAPLAPDMAGKITKQAIYLRGFCLIRLDVGWMSVGWRSD